MSYDPNGADESKLFTVFKMDWKLVSWIVNLSEEVASSSSKYGPTRRTNRSTAEAIPTNEVLKYLLAEILCACRYVLSSSTFISLKSVLILRSEILSYDCFWTLNGYWIGFAEFPTIRYENPWGNQGLLTLNGDSWAQIAYRTWVYWTIYALIFLKIPDQIHHCIHKTSLITSYWNASCYILRV